MAVKRKDKAENHDTPAKNKRIRQEKVGDFSDDEDLSDIDDADVFNGIRIPVELPPITSAEENPGPRMVITEIVANNFKSYYGEVTIGQFHKSLTSIVGANGSGKSNVIDSLLFVFGYRSSKIRSKKVSVLLHKSDKHKDVRQCSVTVHFVHIQDDITAQTGFVPIPGTEIKITRTAFKDNSSFYTLNDKRVKFKDIAIILKKNGIDLVHNRFLILQGEVEQIAMMKPKSENDHSTGMLEYLEDVIGTVRYKKPITKLEERVKDLSLEKNEKITRLKFVAKEREELIEPVEAVINYLKIENRITRISNKIYQKNRFDYESKIEDKTEARNKILDAIKSNENEINTISKNKKTFEKQIQDLSEKLKSDHFILKKNEEKLKKCLRKNGQLNDEYNQAKAQITKYENSIQQEQKKITKAEGVPKIKEAELKKLKTELPILEEKCIELEANYTKVNSSGFEKSKKFRDEKDVLAPEELKLQKLVGCKQNQFQTLKTEFEVLIDTEKSEKEKLSHLEEQMEGGVEKFQENMRKKEKAEADIHISKDIIKDLETKIKKLNEDEIQLKTKLQNIRQCLTEKRSAYAETTERSRPIQYILNLKDKGEIKGLLGRCGDYGQVEGKFDIPACTACGSTDQIVVETSDAAHACIQKLRTNNIGRLTFSIMPQVQKLKSRADSNNNYPENAKRVFDYIKILDQRFRLTFYSGLYDTLLAEDLEQARRIAFGTQTRYRVVTYKGDLIDQSGIMSGGGRPIKGKIGPQEIRSRYATGNSSLVSQNEVENLDKTAKDLEIKLRETQSNIFDFQANIDQNLRQIEDLNIIVKECSSRINAWKEKENQLKNMIETQKLIIIKKKTDPIAVANKKSEIQEAEKELQESKIEYDKIKSKMDSLKKKIEEITQGEPQEAKRLLDQATSKLENTRHQMNQVDIDIQGAQRQIKKSESQIETLKDDIIECKKNMESSTEELKKNEILVTELKEKNKEITISIEEQKTKIKEMTSEDDKNLDRTNKLRLENVNLKTDETNLESEINLNKDLLKDTNSKISKLKLHKIPEIDCAQRDPVIESYQNLGSKSHNKSAVVEDNEKVKTNETNEISQKQDDPDEMQVDDVDDDSDSDTKELPQYKTEQLVKINSVEIEQQRITLMEHFRNLDKPNFKILEEFKKRTQQYNDKANEVAEVLKSYNDHIEMINKVRQRRRDEFMASFRKITIKLKEMYQMITLGGDAELELVDSLDPFSEGINFSVRPPKKTWKVISNLSGGEKTLSSLALVFALHYYKPSPLYVMDEIDAALDFKNVSIIAYYIKERTKNSQFIIISLRSNMFEKANVLVGIYKTNDCTATSSVTTDKYQDILKGALYKYAK
ncbi:structural maintenance of chromosomes protein 4 [Myzus persicae]|uniref:structural maintenance of chromosomes protein 4 n=1 Tax=Myzus persicae TaxID=13164 RepID=UPI000B9313DA|nr:structural maintenance of chromosomes protein 4 [Myzus persicae]XP_022172389.1 structural maintenance of chromosomes protein 4 [Myzus persicae]